MFIELSKCESAAPLAQKVTHRVFSDLPESSGWLPTWQLTVAVMALFNTVQNFTTLKLTRRIYDNVPSATGQAVFIVSTVVRSLTRGGASNVPSSKNVRCLDTYLCGRARLCGLQYP